jgi:hypothetical protein
VNKAQNAIDAENITARSGRANTNGASGELHRQDQKDHQHGQRERRQELVALGAQLARLAGVIEVIPRRQDLTRGGMLEERECVVQGAGAHAGELHRIDLLETVERAQIKWSK